MRQGTHFGGSNSPDPFSMSRSKIIVDQNRGNNPFPPKKNLVSSRAMTNFNMDNTQCKMSFWTNQTSPRHSKLVQKGKEIALNSRKKDEGKIFENDGFADN